LILCALKQIFLDENKKFTKNKVELITSSISPMAGFVPALDIKKSMAPKVFRVSLTR